MLTKRAPTSHFIVYVYIYITLSCLIWNRMETLQSISMFLAFTIYDIWGRFNLKRSRRTVIFLLVYKLSSLKITPPKTQNSGQYSYPLPNIVSFLFEKNQLEFRLRSRDFSFNLFLVWQPYCWRFWSTIVPIHTSTINAPKKGAYNIVHKESHNSQERIEDTKVIMRTVNQRTDNAIANKKRTTWQTLIYKTIQRRLSNTNHTKHRGWTHVLSKG